MTVPENKTVNSGVLLQILIGKDYRILLVCSQEWSIALDFMLNHAMTRPTVSHPQAPTRMEHRKHPPEKTTAETCTHESVHPVTRELVTMRKIYLLSINFKQARFTMNCHTAFLFEIIETPLVMVTCKKMHLYTAVCKFGQLAKETCIALRYGITEFVPEIEHIPQHIYCSCLILNLVEKRYETTLMGAAMLNGPRAKVSIGKEIYLLFHNGTNILFLPNSRIL